MSRKEYNALVNKDIAKKRNKMKNLKEERFNLYLLWFPHSDLKTRCSICTKPADIFNIGTSIEFWFCTHCGYDSATMGKH